jgi:hypothetical protein
MPSLTTGIFYEKRFVRKYYNFVNMIEYT